MSYIQNKRIFYIDSHQRVTGSHSDFAYSINLNPTEKYDRCVVLSAVIPKSYYLIAAPYSSFTLTEGTSNVTVTIPDGNYSASSFRIAVTNLLNAVSPNHYTYSITYPNTATSANTGLYTYSVTGNSGTQPSFTFSSNDTVNEQFGFDVGTYTFSGNTLTSINVIKMQSEDTVYIHSDMCTNGTDNVLQEIFSNAPDFSSIKYQCVNVEAYSKNITTQNNNVYRFIITDEDGRTLNLNGLNVVFVLCVYKNDDINEMIKSYLKYKLLEQPQK